MAPLGIFGIGNDALNLVVSLLLLFLVALWLALVAWTILDARRRIADGLLVGCAAAASLLFPFVGTIIYMILRPPEYLDDVRERELEIAAAEARLHSLEVQACPYCDFEIEKGFLRCPSCLRKLKEPCNTCGKPLDPRWKICPYCEAEIGAAPGRGRARSIAGEPAGGGGGAVARPRPSSGARPPAGTRPPAGANFAAGTPSAGGAQAARPGGGAATGRSAAAPRPSQPGPAGSRAAPRQAPAGDETAVSPPSRPAR